jgi:Arc/MetJ-type ribon-helix-helix transcriptional regulator
VGSPVRKGAYRSREAAIVAAVLHHKRRSEQLAWLQSEIQKGLDSGSAGELDINEVMRRGFRTVICPISEIPSGVDSVFSRF